MQTKSSLRMRSVVLSLTLLAAASVGTVGCTNVMVTKDIAGRVRLGELQVFVEADFAPVYAASKEAIKEYGLFQTKDEKKVVEAELEARDRADTLVTVSIKEVAKNRTSIKIRYGITGDVAQSQKLFALINKHL